MPQGEARGQKVFFYFSVMETTYADSWSDMAQSCDIDLWVMKWRSAWPIFHGPVILPCILKTIWCMYIIHWDYESVWCKVWPQNKCRSLWSIFYGPVILPCILKTIRCMNIIIWDYESIWPDVWPQIIVGHCDVFFMVQWSCVISWRLFECFHLMYKYHTSGLCVIMTRHLTLK